MARFAVSFLPRLLSSVLRDLLTAALLLLPYWQAGQFFITPNAKLQQRLAAFDRRLLQNVIPDAASWGKAFTLYVELARLAVYAPVPLGLAVLYFAHERHCADYFQTVVLTATYLCCATTPFVQALPPRFFRDSTSDVPVTNLRLLNHPMLRPLTGISSM